MSNYGLKISKSGNDVKDCANNKLIFSSAWNNYKIFVAGTVNASINQSGSSYTTTTIYHGLGYIPAILGYWIITGCYPLPSLYDVQNIYIYYKIDSNNLYILANQATPYSLPYVTIRFIIFYEQLA